MSQTVDRIMESVPGYYESSRVFLGIQAAKAAEWDNLDVKKEDLKVQTHPSTATWGLRYFEEGLGIAVIESDPYDVRRSRVIAKRRSPGNFSIALLKSVCESFTNGEVVITIDFALGQVNIKLVGTLGIPTNLQDLKDVVETIIHAHLGTAYTFTYLLVKEIHNVMTIDELQTTPFTQFAFNTERG